MVIYIALAGLMGYMIGSMIKQGGDRTKPVMVLKLGYAFLWFIISLLAGIVIHEGGHLVMGLKTGYEFVSFRVGSFIWKKQDGKLVCKRFSVQGTAGQCLLMPKETDEPEKMPCKAYFLGGGLFYLINAAIFMPLSLLVSGYYIKLPLFLLGLISVYLGLVNLIPMNAQIANDGYQVFMLDKHPGDKVFIYKQLRINGLLYQGFTPGELDPKLFEYPDDLSKENLAGALLLKASLLIAQHDYTNAKPLLEQCLEDKDLMQLYVFETKCELIFCECMLGAPSEQIDKLIDKNLRTYIAASGKTLISKARVMYAYQLLCKKDEQAAQAEYDKAMKMRSSYPIDGELKSELDLIETVKQLWESNGSSAHNE